MKTRLFYITFLLAALLTIAGCSSKPDDTAIATDIKAKMFSDPNLKTLALEVTVKNGEVTLLGDLPSAELQLKAYKLAESVTGVTKVIDAMKVQTASAKETEPPKSQEPLPPPASKPPVVQSTADRPAADRPAPPSSAPVGAPGRPGKAEAIEPGLAETPRTETAKTVAPTEKAAPPKPKKIQVEVPTGTKITIRMVDGIDSSVNKVGEAFRATVDVAVVINGQEVIPNKTVVFVELVQARSAGKMTGQSELELALHSMELGGETYRLSSDTYEQVGKSRGKDTALKVGVATGIGTAIGAIAGGKKGAAIGAAVGAGSGVAIQAVTRGQQVKVPTETELEFRLKAPVSVTYTIVPTAKE